MAANFCDVAQAGTQRYFPFHAVRDISEPMQGTRLPVRTPSTNRDEWTARFSRRLAELRCEAYAGVLSQSASGLFSSVGHFNPEIAAEMEYEIGRAEH